MYRIGVDLGGMTIKCGIVDNNGEILYKDSCDTMAEKDNDEIVSNMAKLILKVIEESDISKEKIESIGVGSPGTIDVENGIVLNAYNLGFENVEVKKILEREVGLPVFIENDANCAAIAEYHAGNGKGYKNVFVLTIGTGIGGGLVRNGKCDSGSFFTGGEFGHMVISANGNQCTCGRKGCFEAYCSATALIKRMKEVCLDDHRSILMELAENASEKLTPIVLFQALGLKCPAAQKVIEEYNFYLSDALANFINIFEPEIILIGGGISKQGEKLLADVRKATYEKAFNKNSKVKIETTKFFNDAGIIGASFLGK